MKTLISLTLLCASAAAAEFSNLDFEQANPNLSKQDQGPFGSDGLAADLIPHWSFWLGTERQSLIGHNRSTIDSPLSCLHDGRPFGVKFNRFPAPPFEGIFGFMLKSQIRDTKRLPSLRQEGTLPLGVQSIRIRVFGDPIKLFLNDQPIVLHYELIATKAILPYHPISMAYGDISGFGGKRVLLKIEPDAENAIRTFSGIDNIEFLHEPILLPDESIPLEDDPILLRLLK